MYIYIYVYIIIDTERQIETGYTEKQTGYTKQQ